jgi:hypothetical protein
MDYYLVAVCHWTFCDLWCLLRRSTWPYRLVSGRTGGWGLAFTPAGVWMSDPGLTWVSVPRRGRPGLGILTGGSLYSLLRRHFVRICVCLPDG